MSCAVRSCRNDTHRLPQLSFFSLPRQNHLKEEWLEVLGIERSASASGIKVCEVHFKPKDFCVGKKQLKTHAVPVLKLGSGKSEPIDSEDEFMEYNSDDDPEVIEVDMENASEALKDHAGQADKNETKQEPEKEEVEEGRRPSRRAAREAAKKIYNTVRNYMPKTESEYSTHSPVAASGNSPRTAASRQKNSRSSAKTSSVDVNLIMECHEEILSAVQAEALLKAQLEYNMVMKTLRSLKAQNVKIIVAKDPIVSPPPPTPAKGTTTFNIVSTTPNLIFQKPQVLPMVLTSLAP